MKVYLVIAERGSYDDYRASNIGAYTDINFARRHAAAAKARAEEIDAVGSGENQWDAAKNYERAHNFLIEEIEVSETFPGPVVGSSPVPLVGEPVFISVSAGSDDGNYANFLRAKGVSK